MLSSISLESLLSEVWDLYSYKIGGRETNDDNSFMFPQFCHEADLVSDTTGPKS